MLIRGVNRLARFVPVHARVQELHLNLNKYQGLIGTNFFHLSVVGQYLYGDGTGVGRSYGTINHKEDDDSEKLDFSTVSSQLNTNFQLGVSVLLEETNTQELDIAPYEQQISEDSPTAQNPTISISQIVELLEKWNKIIDNIPLISQKAQVLIRTLEGKEKTFNGISAKITETLTAIANSDLKTEIAKLNMGLLNLKQLGALSKLLDNIQKKPEHIPYAISFIAEKSDNLPDTIGSFDKYVRTQEAPPIVAPQKKEHNPAHIPFLPSENIDDLKRRTGLINVRYGSEEEVAEATSKINQKKSDLSGFSGNIAHSKANISVGKQTITDDVVIQSFSPDDELPADFTNLELETKPIFTHLILDTENYPQEEIRKNPILGNAWPRNRDSEYIILSILAKKLEKQAEDNQLSNEDIKGEVSIASLYPYCLSCQGVIKQFNLKFPNVCIILIDATKKK